MAVKGISYDDMVQGALLGVVRDILRDVSVHGLPGAHHFYIAFRTGHPGVEIPDYLRERYQEEMTIVLQNQFWDLNVADDRFEVRLSFNQKPALLSIPFAALTGFLDPSVEFGLQFQPSERTASGKDRPQATEEAAAGKKTRTQRKAKAAQAEPDETPDGEGGEANVVALDTFRKKK